MEVLKHSHCLEPHSSSFEAGYYILTMLENPFIALHTLTLCGYTSTEKKMLKTKTDVRQQQLNISSGTSLLDETNTPKA